MWLCVSTRQLHQACMLLQLWLLTPITFNRHMNVCSFFCLFCPSTRASFRRLLSGKLLVPTPMHPAGASLFHILTLWPVVHRRDIRSLVGYDLDRSLHSYQITSVVFSDAFSGHCILCPYWHGLTSHGTRLKCVLNYVVPLITPCGS